MVAGSIAGGHAGSATRSMPSVPTTVAVTRSPTRGTDEPSTLTVYAQDGVTKIGVVTLFSFKTSKLR